MRIALSELEFTIQGTGSKSKILPLFLHSEEKNKVQVIINFLEENIGRKKSEIDYDPLWTIFPTQKITKTLIASAARFYSFETQNLSDIFKIKQEKEKKKEENRKGNIQDFLPSTTKKEPSILYLSPEELREQVFDYVNLKKKGFVALEERETIMRKIESELSIPFEVVNNLLYIDSDSEKVLVKKGEVKALELIRLFNYDTIETLLCFAHQFELTLQKLPGYLAKNLIFLSKKNYVFTEIFLEEKQYRITISPPLELFREQSTWGKNIANVAMYAIQVILKEKIDFTLLSIVKPKDRRKAIFKLNSAEIPLLPTYEKTEEETTRPEIDSKIENIFFKTWKNFHGWKAIPEAEVLIINRRMYVPDFLLERGNNRVYLEIIGYYTLKYIQKKKKQIQELLKTNVQIIYLIDKNLQESFLGLDTAKILFYENNIVPNSQLLQLLEDNFSDFDERLPSMIVMAETICSSLKERKSLKMMEMRTELGTYTDEETVKVLENEKVKSYLKREQIRFLPSFGLINEEEISKVETYVKDRKIASLTSLKKDFPHIKEALIAICQNIGCKITWKSLDDAKISFE
ncbi:MAG: DUF790 family protein [Candidatus Heimdallarchaeaceae archaeon]